MAIEIVIESPAEIDLQVEVRGLNKQIIDAFTATWRTPDDDELDMLETLRCEIDDYLARRNNAVFDTALAARQAWSSLRESMKVAVHKFLVSTDKTGWTDGDAVLLLKHNHYLFALFYSLCGVGVAVIEKNALKPDESGQQDAHPAAQTVESPA
ncbi:MAG: hypothetical protein RI964_807 [Pseudomonadota bacterium]|jgi:hypothetical protein